MKFNKVVLTTAMALLCVSGVQAQFIVDPGYFQGPPAVVNHTQEQIDGCVRTYYDRVRQLQEMHKYPKVDGVVYFTEADWDRARELVNKFTAAYDLAKQMIGTQLNETQKFARMQALGQAAGALSDLAEQKVHDRQEAEYRARQAKYRASPLAQMVFDPDYDPPGLKVVKEVMWDHRRHVEELQAMHTNPRAFSGTTDYTQAGSNPAGGVVYFTEADWDRAKELAGKAATAYEQAVLEANKEANHKVTQTTALSARTEELKAAIANLGKFSAKKQCDYKEAASQDSKRHPGIEDNPQEKQYRQLIQQRKQAAIEKHEQMVKEGRRLRELERIKRIQDAQKKKDLDPVRQLPLE